MTHHSSERETRKRAGEKSQVNENQIIIYSWECCVQQILMTFYINCRLGQVVFFFILTPFAVSCARAVAVICQVTANNHYNWVRSNKTSLSLPLHKLTSASQHFSQSEVYCSLRVRLYRRRRGAKSSRVVRHSVNCWLLCKKRASQRNDNFHLLCLHLSSSPLYTVHSSESVVDVVSRRRRWKV